MIKALCDVHISYKIVKFLNERGIPATHVNDLPDKWHTKDNVVCQYADMHDLTGITKDEDFRNTHFVQGTPKRLIRITLGNISNVEWIKILDEHLLVIMHKMDAGKCYFEIGKNYTEVIP
ncbi:MAG: DUF5615 family PIN-like protein [Chitinophagales bacterium]|nr:DUF5615 family PIN-like protein [Chitinophagales bacterium]